LAAKIVRNIYKILPKKILSFYIIVIRKYHYYIPPNLTDINIIILINFGISNRLLRLVIPTAFKIN